VTPETRAAPDPAVCACCGARGSAAWPRLAGIAVCEPCAAGLRNRELPRWLRVSLAALLLLAVLSGAYGWKYWQAEASFLRAQRALSAGQYDVASDRLAEVLAIAPGSEPAFLQKIRADLLSERFDAAWSANDAAKNRKFRSKELGALNVVIERVEKAMDEVKTAHEAEQNRDLSGAVWHAELATKDFPESRTIASYLLQLRGKVAFDAHDYDAVVRYGEEAVKLAPDGFLNHAMLTGGFAAQFAVSGDPELEQRARKELEATGQLAESADQGAAFDSFRERIEHRLRTREILSREEYEQRFRSHP